jgi:hypothetical protein
MIETKMMNINAASFKVMQNLHAEVADGRWERAKNGDYRCALSNTRDGVEISAALQSKRRWRSLKGTNWISISGRIHWVPPSSTVPQCRSAAVPVHCIAADNGRPLHPIRDRPPAVDQSSSRYPIDDEGARTSN